MMVVTIVVWRSPGAKSSKMLGRRNVPAARLAAQAGDSGKNGRITINGSAGTMPDINVYRHGALPSLIVPRNEAHSGSAMVGKDSALVVTNQFTSATNNPPNEEKACVYPSTCSRCLGSVNNSASQATAATNSTHTPTKVVERSTSNISMEVEKPAPKADKA